MNSQKKELEAVVVRNKMQKTAVVLIESRVKHPVFHKFLTVRKKYKVHDEKNEAQPGDLVLIRQSRPLSREKRWVLVKILEKSI